MLKRAIAVLILCGVTIVACQGSGDEGSTETATDSANATIQTDQQPGTAPMGNTGVLPGDTLSPAGSPTGPGTVTGGANTSTTSM